MRGGERGSEVEREGERQKEAEREGKRYRVNYLDLDIPQRQH